MSNYDQMLDLAEMLAIGPERIHKEQVENDITTMATDIYNNTWQQNKRPRTYEQVYNDCKHIVIEYALAQRLGGKRNPKKFNIQDEDSYIWDVLTDRFSDNTLLFECKRHKENGGEFFAYSNNGMKTFLNHNHKLNYLVTAKLIEEKDWYTTKFTYIMDAPTFKDHWEPSRYNDWESIYMIGDHNNYIKLNVL